MISGTVVITGATSAIARAVAMRFAHEGASLILAGRSMDEVERIAGDIRVRTGAEARVAEFDAEKPETLDGWLVKTLGDAELGGVVVCHGADGDDARRVVDVNMTSAVMVLSEAAEILEARGEGFLCAVSSVAGDRGRKSNYPYGAAKAGLSTFMAGLRHRLWKRGVRVVTIKPGFVDTRATWGLPGLFLVASPERAARDICRAIERGRAVRYTPWFWRWIMLVIRLIPEPVFKRTEM